MSPLPIFVTLEPLEKVSLFTPLGIRFWDVAEDRAVVDGLEVIARPPGRPDLARRAFRTMSGVYAFHNLPGMHNLESSDPDLSAGMHPIDGTLSSAPFIVEADDRLNHFLSVSFLVDLPYRGIYPIGPLSSASVNGLPGFLLFSDPNRPMLSALAVVRGQLLERLGPNQFRPARYAVLEVQSTGGPTWLGIANELGSIAVPFPYPQFAASVSPVSPPPSPTQIHVQTWDIRIRARYHQEAQIPLDAFADKPGLRSLLTQPQANIWLGPSGPVQPQLEVTLAFGRPLQIQTAGHSELWVEP
jgi:hypothetical protein